MGRSRAALHAHLIGGAWLDSWSPDMIESHLGSSSHYSCPQREQAQRPGLLEIRKRKCGMKIGKRFGVCW